MRKEKSTVDRIFEVFKGYCTKNGCGIKVVGDWAYRNRGKRRIRLMSGKNNMVELWDSKRGTVCLNFEGKKVSKSEGAT